MSTFDRPRGFRAAGVQAGIKPSGDLDLAILAADGLAAAAGTFTTNRIAAAPVRWDRALLPSESIRAIVINAGNANAATGPEGLENARRTAARAAELLGCAPDAILLASTGVIGRQLPIDRLEAGLERAVAALTDAPHGFEAASRAILTTDTRPKVVSQRLDLDAGACTLLGLAKGAAMIGPRMATMLAFLLTDAPVPARELQTALRAAVDDSFNCLTVEGHTSTNDSVILLARPATDSPTLHGPDLARFGQAVRAVCTELARMIADDAEGASHRITIDVEGCRDRAEAVLIARSIAEDALVKSAICGADPNWGRIVSAAGHAGVPFDEPELSLWLNGVLLYQDGLPVPFDAAALSADLRGQRDTAIRLVFTRGPASVRFWTCDLTPDYVRLNADYTT